MNNYLIRVMCIYSIRQRNMYKEENSTYDRYCKFISM
jgi:hypothetical protein